MQSIGSRLHLFLLYLSAQYTPPSIPVNISAIISIYRRFDTIYPFTNKFRHDETEKYPGATLHTYKKDDRLTVVFSYLFRRIPHILRNINI